jgi:hypothetical protein
MAHYNGNINIPSTPSDLNMAIDWIAKEMRKREGTLFIYNKKEIKQ